MSYEYSDYSKFYGDADLNYSAWHTDKCARVNPEAPQNVHVDSYDTPAKRWNIAKYLIVDGWEDVPDWHAALEGFKAEFPGDGFPDIELTLKAFGEEKRLASLKQRHPEYFE